MRLFSSPATSTRSYCDGHAVHPTLLLPSRLLRISTNRLTAGCPEIGKSHQLLLHSDQSRGSSCESLGLQSSELKLQFNKSAGVALHIPAIYYCRPAQFVPV